jgi:predicted DNA-binding protein with PD1-like motif
MEEKMKRFEFAKGKTGKVIFARIMPGGDFIPSLKNIFDESGITTGQLDTAIGSLCSVNYTFITDGKKYGPPIKREGAFEFLHAGGFISKTDKDIEVHIHAVLADTTGKIFGGHLLENGNTVCATLEIAIIELNGIKISKEFDNETGFNLFKIKRL